MIREAWRRVGVSPTALAAMAMAIIALLLSRGAGSGWLVVLAAGFLGVVAVGGLVGLVGLIGVDVDLVVPTDAVAGDRLTIELRLHAAVPQLRTVRLLGLDDAPHAVDRGVTAISLAAGRRRLVQAV